MTKIVKTVDKYMNPTERYICYNNLVRVHSTDIRRHKLTNTFRQFISNYYDGSEYIKRVNLIIMKYTPLIKIFTTITKNIKNLY